MDKFIELMNIVKGIDLQTGIKLLKENGIDIEDDNYSFHNADRKKIETIVYAEDGYKLGHEIDGTISISLEDEEVEIVADDYKGIWFIENRNGFRTYEDEYYGITNPIEVIQALKGLNLEDGIKKLNLLGIRTDSIIDGETDIENNLVDNYILMDSSNGNWICYTEPCIYHRNGEYPDIEVIGEGYWNIMQDGQHFMEQDY